MTIGRGGGVALGNGVVRSVMRMRRAVDTISRETAWDRAGGIVPATISCSATEIEKASANRRLAAVPKKTPSRS